MMVRCNEAVKDAGKEFCYSHEYGISLCGDIVRMRTPSKVVERGECALAESSVPFDVFEKYL